MDKSTSKQIFWRLMRQPQHRAHSVYPLRCYLILPHPIKMRILLDKFTNQMKKKNYLDQPNAFWFSHMWETEWQHDWYQPRQEQDHCASQRISHASVNSVSQQSRSLRSWFKTNEWQNKTCTTREYPPPELFYSRQKVYFYMAPHLLSFLESA